MAVDTYTKSGAKATTAASMDKNVFGVKKVNHQLLKDAYLSYLANNRSNFAKAKRRGEVRGGGRKPWRQKGTGRARFGSSRNPIWTGGGVAFGPTGIENYARKLNTKAKRQALRQSLSIAALENRIKIIDEFVISDGRVKSVNNLLKKMQIEGNVLIVVEQKDTIMQQATRNLSTVSLKSARYLNVFDVLNADTMVVTKGSLNVIGDILGENNA